MCEAQGRTCSTSPDLCCAHDSIKNSPHTRGVLRVSNPTLEKTFFIINKIDDPKTLEMNWKLITGSSDFEYITKMINQCLPGSNLDSESKEDQINGEYRVLSDQVGIFHHVCLFARKKAYEK